MTDEREWRPSPARYEDALASLGRAMKELCDVLDQGDEIPEQLHKQAKERAAKASTDVTRELFRFLDATALYLGIDEPDADRRYFQLALDLALQKFGSRKSNRAATGKVKSQPRRAGRGDRVPPVVALLLSTYGQQVEEQFANGRRKFTQKAAAKEFMKLGVQAGLTKEDVDSRGRQQEVFLWTEKTVTKQLRTWPAKFDEMTPAQRAEVLRDLEFFMRKAGVDPNSETVDRDYLDPSTGRVPPRGVRVGHRDESVIVGVTRLQRVTGRHHDDQDEHDACGVA